MRRSMSDKEIRAEIKELQASPEVKLARAEQRARSRERQYLYTLRSLAKRGAQLRSQGKTIEDFRTKEHENEDELLLAATEV